MVWCLPGTTSNTALLPFEKLRRLRAVGRAALCLAEVVKLVHGAASPSSPAKLVAGRMKTGKRVRDVYVTQELDVKPRNAF